MNQFAHTLDLIFAVKDTLSTHDLIFAVNEPFFFSSHIIDPISAIKRHTCILDDIAATAFIIVLVTHIRLRVVTAYYCKHPFWRIHTWKSSFLMLLAMNSVIYTYICIYVNIYAYLSFSHYSSISLSLSLFSMFVCVDLYTYVYTYTCGYTHIHIYLHIHIYMCAYVCMCVCVLHACICISTSICLHIYVYMSICKYISLYIFIFLHSGKVLEYICLVFVFLFEINLCVLMLSLCTRKLWWYW